ncbi:MAG: T9SS type A sorting domain-containing protein [Cyclobacteriaceae bacterium]
MKKLFTLLKATAMSVALIGVSSVATAQWTGTSAFLNNELASRLGPVAVGINSIPAAPPGPALKLYVNQNFGQRSSGTFGLVTSASSEWTSIGKGPTGTLPFYGIRTQDGPLGLLTGSDNNNQPTITWTDNLNTATSSGSELRFNFVGSDDIKRTYGRWDARGNLFLGTNPGGVSTNFYELYVYGYENFNGWRGQVIDVDAESKSFNIGLFARTRRGTRTNWGILSRASGSASTVIGIETRASGGTTNNYGILARASGANAFAGFFNGDVQVNGSFSVISDGNLKVISTKAKPSSSALDRFRSLNTYDYTFRQDSDVAFLNLPQGQKHGFIAQDIQAVFPDLVRDVKYRLESDDATGEGGKRIESIDYLAVDYISMIPYIVEAIKELDGNRSANATMQQRITEMEAETAELRRRLEEMEGSSNTNNSFESSAKVFGNTPNPFSAETRIAYELPANSNATLIVYNMSGEQIMTFDNLRSGSGEVVIEGRSLEAGMYIYTLIANGQEVDTRRMILTK